MPRKKYNIEYLQEYCRINNINLLKKYNEIDRETKIEGKCVVEDCDNSFCKKFRQLEKTGGYCFYHKEKIRKQLTKKTCLEKYGVEHSSKNEEVKEKHIKTCLEKYGVKCSFQNEKVKEKYKKNYLEKYGVENPSYNKDVIEKKKNTFLEKYGVSCSLQNEKIKEKSKNTCLEKYGAVHPFKNEKIKEKSKNTCLEKYGVMHPIQNEEIKQKYKKTCLDKYGVEYPIQNEAIKDKIKNTCLEKYGNNNPMQNPDIMDKNMKNSFKIKNYKLQSGTILQYQGYENFAIDELLQNGITEQEIINGCENIPEIWYISSKGKRRRHFVDLFLPSENKCIEVKSTWTISSVKDSEEIFNKQDAAKNQGYAYEIWVYNGKGEKVECYK